MQFRRLALAFLLPLCFASCAPLPPPQTGGGARAVVSNGGSIVTLTETLIALPGHTLKVGFFHDPQNADCSMQANQHIVFTVLTQPQHGTLDVQPEMDFPGYPANDLMFKCNTGQIPGTEVTYVAAPGFSGADQISYSIYFPNGHELVVNNTLDVQQ